MARIPQNQDFTQSDYTKKDLESLFDVSDNTVNATLKACGLPTSKRQYTREEVIERFLTARKMFDSGKSSSEITELFALKHATVNEEDIVDDSMMGEREEAFGNLIEDQMIDCIHNYAYERAGSVIPHMGEIIIDALMSRALEDDHSALHKRVHGIAKRYRPGGYLPGSVESVEGGDDT